MREGAGVVVHVAHAADGQPVAVVARDVGERGAVAAAESLADGGQHHVRQRVLRGAAVGVVRVRGALQVGAAVDAPRGGEQRLEVVVARGYA